MAIESPITAEHNWFKSEDKLLRFTIFGQDGKTVQPIGAGWTFRFDFYRRRSANNEPPLFQKSTNAGVTVLNAAAGLVSVSIDAVNTATLEGDSFNYVLWRTDLGNGQVLAYGGAVLRSAVTA